MIRKSRHEQSLIINGTFDPNSNLVEEKNMKCVIKKSKIYHELYLCRLKWVLKNYPLKINTSCDAKMWKFS